MPPGGDGFYYFSAYFVVWYFEWAYFDIQINGELICTAFADRNSSDNADSGPTSCSATTLAVEGKKFTYPVTKFIIYYSFMVLDMIAAR